jgi:copper transport protein
VALVATALCALVATQGAAAHANVRSTSPPNEAVVQRTPARVVVRFDEAIETSLGSVRVLDASGRRVDSGDITRPTASSVAVAIGRTLPRGSYTVAWRVISADTHPVHGAFVFSVGAASADADAVAAKVLASQSTPRSISVSFGLVRLIGFVLMLAIAGGALALVVVLRDASDRVRRLLWLVLAGAGALLVPVCAAGIVFQGASAGGFGLTQSLRWTVVSSVVDSRFGVWWTVRAVAGAAIVLTALAARRIQLAEFATLALGFLLLVTASASAHARVDGTFTLVADVVHLLAAAAWTGGLAAVVAALVLAGPDRWPLAAKAVPRFSTVAVGAVVALVIAGVFGGYQEVRAWRGLWETTYGQLLLAKVGLLVPLLALGAYNNRFAVPRLRREIASIVEQRRFLRMAVAELVLFVGVLGVTAALVAEPPARASVAPSGPVERQAELGPFQLNLVVDPAKPGPNAIHIYLLRASGQPASVAEASVQASLPSAGVGPLRLKAFSGGPGHFIVSRAQLPIAGSWQLKIIVRRGEFDEWEVSLPIPIESGR